MSDDAILRLAIESDKNQILKLLNQVFDDQQRTAVTRGDAFWNWKFITNPFGKSLLTVAEVDGRIVSVANLLPWEFHCRGRVIKALQACDSVVDPEFGGRGLFTTNRMHGIEISRERNYELIFNFPNENSLPIYRSLGWDYLGKIDWWVKILKPINIVRGMVGSNQSKPYSMPEKYRVNVNRLDEIAEQSVSYDGYLKTNRIEGFHEWRYKEHPTRDYGIINVDRGRKKTSAVFTINEKGMCREMVIVDLVGALNNTDLLMKSVVKSAKEMEADFIALMQNFQFTTENLWKLGFIKKKNKNMTVLPLKLNIENKSSQFENWSMIASMHDSI